jgi:serine/threonine-protein kinase
MSLTPGTRLGAYEVAAQIGEGGMGQVYRAHDSRIGRDVAIKVLPAEYAADAERLRRFEQESRATGALNHPNILTLYDVGTANGQPYLVMELLDGETLRDRISRGALSSVRACEIAASVARGLSAAHAKGVVHRDLKPENIMITRDSRVKVLDFGIAKLRATDVAPDGRTSAAPLHTAPLVVMGTAGYMAPEQVRGLPADERADLFALGVILVELLTGRRAFDRDSRIETLNAILHDDPPPLVNPTAPVPQVVERIVQRCLERDPDARFQSARDLAFALDNTPGTASSTATMAVAGTTRNRSGLGVGMTAALALIAAGLAALATWALRPVATAPPSRPMARFALPPPPDATFGSRPAISLDGNLLVFPGQQRLLLRRLDQLEAAEIPGTEGGSLPFFSPDGQFVAFAADGKIKKISMTVAAASPVVVLDERFIMGATWAPDNTIIYGSINHGLQRVSADGGVAQPVTTPDMARSEIDHHFPRLLPGGKAVMFTAHLGTERFQVGAQVLATGERKVLIESGFDAQYSSTGHLVYGKGSSLFAVPFDADRLEVTGAPVKLFDDIRTILSNGEALFSLSPSGTLVFVPSPPSTARQLVWMDRSGVATPIATTGARAFANPRLSPDGQRFAVTVAEREQQNIWVYQLGNERFAPVTFGELNNAPLWTPDGSHLTYTSVRDGIQHLFWQPTDGSGSAESLIASQKNNINPGAWTADGRSLVYLEDPPTGATEVKVLTLDGRRSEVVPGIPARSYWPTLSPDGRWLAFVFWTGARPDINVQPFPGPGLRRQIAEGGTEPVWSRDGRELFFRSRRAPGAPSGRPSDEGIFASPFDLVRGEASGQPVQLFRGRFAHNERNLPMYDVTPDGRRFVIVMAGEEEYAPVNLNVVVNLGDELRRRVPAK